MQENLKQRLIELKVEYDSGQHVLSELEERQASLKGTMLRISGAIQVLEELLNQEPAEEQTPEVVKAPKLQKVASG